MRSTSSAALAASLLDSSAPASTPSPSASRTMLVSRVSPDSGRISRCSGTCAHFPSSPVSVTCWWEASPASPSAPHLVAARPPSISGPSSIASLERAIQIWIAAENVPGIGDDGIERVSRDLEAEGYSVWAFDADTALPQRQRGRHRIIWLAHANDALHARQPIDAEMARLRDLSGSRWQNDPAPMGMDDVVSGRMERFRQLGNAFTPFFAEVLGKCIVMASLT